MKKFLLLSLILTFTVSFSAEAQRTVSGTVTSSEDGSEVPGVNVVLKGTTTGTTTDFDGNYRLSVPEEGGILVFSFIGMETMEVDIGARSVIDVELGSDVQRLTEVVVTALGIEREERSLGYAVQEVSGDEVSTAREASFISSLSGKVAGLNINKSNNIGGSVNAVIRGSNSFTGNNQALFVVDGVPISNSNLNTSNQQAGGGGYDYGNAASNIDPETIESISVLKGATAAALYGSEAANGVILITTKDGSKTRGIGVTVNHITTFSKYDKSTFPEYQKEYGAGYGPYYGATLPGLLDVDIDGDGVTEYVVPAGEDASFGQAFDEDLLVYQWDSFYPQLDSYLEPSAWVAAEHGPEYVFETGVSNVTSVSVQGGNETGSFRLGYTNDDRTGILPNSEVNTDVVDFNATYNFTDRFRVDGKATYTQIAGKGRYGTGYDGRNIMQGMRQWFQSNVDLKDQKDAYFDTRENITWNPNDHENLTPHYFDNPYWTLHENYETDRRNRFFGKFQANYEIADWVSLIARFGVDTYSDLQEERLAIGSLDQSEYEKFQRTFEQHNHDYMLNFDHEFSENFSVRGLLGVNIRNTRIISTRASTNGGLVNDRIYSLQNSVSALVPPTESDVHIKKYGYYGQASFGFYDILYLEGTARVDQSSTLPEDNNTYLYPSVSGSFVFSELFNSPVLSFAKLRVGYASVANDAPEYSLQNTYTAAAPFTTPLFYLSNVANNPELKPERTDEIEAGVEFKLFENRISADISVYQRNTIDQIMPVEVSSATGFTSRYVNAGEMRNRGMEVSLLGRVIETNDFTWSINVNWARNVNEVLSLFEDGENLLIFSAWSTAINARKGEPYGTITGTDYVYYENGEKIVGSDGKYLMTESTTEVIGNIQPDWIGGINNIFRYKGLSFSFLIDMQQGGDIISYDMGFGRATGLYKETAGLNELGNPKRDPVDEGGGILLDGVTADGTPNTIRAEAGDYLTPYGYYGGSAETGGYAPDASLVYDASYIKLREVTLTYALPGSLFSGLPIENVSLGVFGRNLWIIHKNLPYGDPEYNSSSGNLRGIQNGALPATNEYGFNVNVQF